jgi:hypothetical protein
LVQAGKNHDLDEAFYAKLPNALLLNVRGNIFPVQCRGQHARDQVIWRTKLRVPESIFLQCANYCQRQTRGLSVLEMINPFKSSSGMTRNA